jgi:hypothetical protein
VVPCAHFCLYIKCKRNNYTGGIATYTHEQLLLASNKYNLLVQESIFGAKSLKEEKIIAMQAELTALKGQFVLPPNFQCAAGNKKDGEKKAHVKKDQQKSKKKNKKNTENKKKQKQMETGQRVPPKDGQLHEKEARQSDLPLVLPPHGVGQPFCQGLLHGPGTQEGAEQGTQHTCSFGCCCHHR